MASFQRNLLFLAFGLSSAFVSLPALAQQKLDQASQTALTQTQQMMTDPATRAKEIKGDTAAEAVDQKVHQTLGAQTDEAYALAAEILQTLVQQSNGDPEKLQAMMLQLQKNPESLPLTPAQREKLKAIAGKVESQSKNSAPK